MAFANFTNKFLVVYQDDLIAYSNKEDQHCEHLERIFIRALEYGISLNPKKYSFGVVEGKLLGHIVSKDGVRIDTERVMAIDKLSPPRNVKGIQSFFGQVNFLRRFVTNFVEISIPISRMLKKEEKIEWNEEVDESFRNIKKAIKDAPILRTLDYGKPM